MIQSYLKTGMVFYDDQNKQHWRSDCCKEIFYHYTDHLHFPSFQFFTDMPISIEEIQIEIYDLQDNLIGTFADVDFNVVNTIYHGTAGYTYVHNNVDIISYPAEINYVDCYYLKLCFYDEVDVRFIHSTDDNGSTYATIAGDGHGTPTYYANNKTYQVWMQRDENGYDSRAMIWAYNHETEVEGANYDLKSTSEVSGDTDYHARPSVIVADDGHIIVAQEFVRIGDGNHNDAITIKRSDNAHDETSWVNAKAENADYYTFIGSWQPDNSARLTYPQFHKDTSGNIYVVCRRYATGGRYDRIYKSTDHGITWDSGHDIIDSENNSVWVYPVPVNNKTEDTLRVAISTILDGPDLHEKIFYIESDDGGVTWHDISNSFSKDTVALGAITMTELENVLYDFLVVNKTIVAQDGITAVNATCNDEGKPFIITMEYTGGVYDYRMFYWDGDSWENSIIETGLNYRTYGPIIHIEGTVFDYYFEETANQMTLYRTTDLTTWTKIRNVRTTAGLTVYTFIWNDYTNNYKDTDYRMFVGIYGTDADYSDIFVEIRDLANPIFCWYSEAFRICDCEVDGVGDGLNLIENGWFEDWAGLAEPDDYPIGWTLTNESAGNYVEDAGGECRMISDNVTQIEISQTILTIGKWYVAEIDIINAVDGGLQLFHNGAALVIWTTTGVKNYIFQATETLIHLRKHGLVTDITFTNFRVEEFIGFDFCDKMTLNWWADCDWDSIIYQFGYKNSLVLADPNKIELQTPSEDIVVNSTERLGKIFVNDVIIKKRYMFKIRIPEYLWNALIRLAAYGSEMPNFHCWITLPDGSSCSMSEVNVLGEWDTVNCMNTFTVEFVDNDEYPVVATNCCDEDDYSEV